MRNKGVIVVSAKLAAFRNSLTREAVLRRAPFVVIGALFWAALYLGTYNALFYIRAIDIVGEANAARFIEMVYFSLMGFVFLSSLVTALSTFYLSRDLDLLRALPLGVNDVLDVKAVETVAESTWMVLGFMPPVLVAMGAAYGAGWVYYPAGLAMFVAFVLVSAGAGMASAHLLARLFPARRLRQALLLSGLLLFVLAYVFLRSSASTFSEDPLRALRSLTLLKIESPLLPYYWISETSMSLLRGGRADWLYPVALASSCLFFLLLSRWAGALLYEGNLGRFGGGRERARAGAPLYPGRGLALLWKDSRLFFRDAAQWSQVLIILALAFVYVYNFSSIPLEAMASYRPLIRDFLVLVNVLMAGLVLSAVAARFAFASVSAEGGAFWVVRAAPLLMRDFLIAKYLYSLVPISLFTVSMAALSNLALGAGGVLTGISAAAVLLLSVSVCGLGTGLGAMWPRFEHENIASVSMGLGGMTFMVAAMCVVAATVALLAWPYYLYLRSGSLSLPWTALCAALALALNLAALYFPMRAGARALTNPAA